jgi:hypothetical protein
MKRTNHITKQVTVSAALAAFTLGAPELGAVVYDLRTTGSQELTISGATPGVFGGSAIVADNWTQPAGTGVFQPFLTLDANGQTSTGGNYLEQAYNTDGFSALYPDQLRPQWNDRLTVADLAKIDVGGSAYYAFILDANEPGAGKSGISLDNVRIYTSSTDNTGLVGTDYSKLDQLGDLRWALNNPLAITTVTDKKGNVTSQISGIQNSIYLDAAQENVAHNGPNPPNGGSGQSDLILYVPVSAFAAAKGTDFLWFYNLNGYSISAEGTGADLTSTAGFEEWRAVLGPHTTVPDGGTTAALLGLGVIGLAAVRRKS